MISEGLIEKTLLQLNDEENFTTYVVKLKEKQPNIFAYLVSEQFDMLSGHHKDMMIFLAVTIWACFLNKEDYYEVISQDMIGLVEERNWLVMNNENSKDFAKKIDPFFEESSQEELLSLIEDSLVPDEDEPISLEDRSFIFVSLKTLVDVLDEEIEVDKN